MVGLLSMEHPVPIFMMLLAPFCAVMAFYPYYFAPNAAGAFYTFPINKRQLFWTNAVAGLILMIVPLVIFGILLLMPIHYPGPIIHPNWEQTIDFPQALFSNVMVGSVINSFSVIVGFIARLALGMFFYYSVFLLAISVSGNRVVAILLCGAIPLIPIGAHVLIEVIATIYVFGYEGLTNNTRLLYTAGLTNPVGIGNIIRDSTQPLVLYYASYIIITVVLTAVAYICGHIRKLERTGDSVVFTTISKICVFLVATSGMIFIGAISMSTLSSRTALYIGFVIGFIIAYFIGQMIAEKTLDVRHKIKTLIPYGGIMVGLYAVMLFVTNIGMSSYIYHIPNPSEVYGVSINHGFHWRQEHLRPYVVDEESISRTMEIHQMILNDRRYFTDMRWQANTRGNWRDFETVPIVYILHDGTTISRQYTVSFDFAVASGLGELRHSPQMRMAEMPALTRPEVIETVRITLWDLSWDAHREFVHERMTMQIPISGYEEISSLFRALGADYVEQTAGSWENILAARLDPEGAQLEWERIQQEATTRISFDVVVYQRYWDMYRWDLWLWSLEGEDAVNTMAWLEERGY